MFDFFEGDNLVWFYAVPFAIFAPLYFSFVWHIGLKNLFKRDPEKERQNRLARAQQDQINQRRAKKAWTRPRLQHAAISPSGYWIAQGLIYCLFLLVLGVFSAYPGYRYLAPKMAEIKLSLSHPGQRIAQCVERTEEELRRLAPNMRAKQKCPRERSVVSLEFEVDGQRIFSGRAAPAGLRSDGASSFYERFRVAAGTHILRIRMNDGDPSKEHTHQLTEEVELTPGQNLVVGFHEQENRFYIH